MQIIERIQPSIERAKEFYNGLSSREKQLIAWGSVVLIIIALFWTFRPIKTLFSEQELELEKAKRDVQDIATDLSRYSRLQQRRNEVEQDFKSVEIKEGALSYLETLIRDKAGISQGAFTIKDQAPKPFGAGYEQTFFSVTFPTTDYSRLIDFLQELVDGPKPLVIKRLDLKRSRSGDKLEVNLEISSITKEK